MNDFNYTRFNNNSKDTYDKLDRLEKLCEVYQYVGQCPILFLLWNRDFNSLRMFFHLESQNVNGNIQMTELCREHVNQAWYRYLTWSEMILSSAFDLRIFILQNKEWVQEMLEEAGSERRETMKYVINKITDFIDDFINLCKTGESFWKKLLLVNLKDYPYLIMYSSIALN
jgi:hypothetical protein